MNVVKQAIQGYTQNMSDQKISENEAALQSVSLPPLIQKVRNANLSLEEYAAFGLCVAGHSQIN